MCPPQIEFGRSESQRAEEPGVHATSEITVRTGVTIQDFLGFGAHLSPYIEPLVLETVRIWTLADSVAFCGVLVFLESTGVSVFGRGRRTLCNLS